MAFTVQDDGGSIAGANAYHDSAFFTSYHTDRNVTSVVDGDFTSAEIQAAIVVATDYIDQRFEFVGDRNSLSQTTEWPRLDAFDRDGYIVQGIPEIVKEACAEYALAHLADRAAGGSGLFKQIDFQTSGQVVTSERTKVDVIEEEFTYSSSSSVVAKFPVADSKLSRSGLIVTGRRVLRA